jgi:hypothetical protein
MGASPGNCKLTSYDFPSSDAAAGADGGTVGEGDAAPHAATARQEEKAAAWMNRFMIGSLDCNRGGSFDKDALFVASF